MNQLLDLPILDLEFTFPEQLYLLKHSKSQRFGCYCHQGIHGLACFSSEVKAICFAERNNLEELICITASFDEAREVAKDRPLPVVALMLLDRLDDPRIHYVR